MLLIVSKKSTIYGSMVDINFRNKQCILIGFSFLRNASRELKFARRELEALL